MKEPIADLTWSTERPVKFIMLGIYYVSSVCHVGTDMSGRNKRKLHFSCLAISGVKVVRPVYLEMR